MIKNGTGRKVQINKLSANKISNMGYIDIFLPMTVVFKETFELFPTTLILPRRARFVALSSQQSHIPINAHGNETLSPGLNPGQKRGTKEPNLGLETGQQSPGQKPPPPPEAEQNQKDPGKTLPRHNPKEPERAQPTSEL